MRSHSGVAFPLDQFQQRPAQGIGGSLPRVSKQAYGPAAHLGIRVRQSAPHQVLARTAPGVQHPECVQRRARIIGIQHRFQHRSQGKVRTFAQQPRRRPLFPAVGMQEQFEPGLGTKRPQVRLLPRRRSAPRRR